MLYCFSLWGRGGLILYLGERKNIRLGSHDYSSEDCYYITICTEGRQYLFGHKEGDEITLTPIGKIVQDSWQKISQLYPYIAVDEFCVMPTHLHGILIYNKVENSEDVKPLESVIRNFKSFTTHEYYKDKRRLTPNLWRRGYYEHIVRWNELDIIREYILNNTVNWENSRFYELQQQYLQSL
jgi:REP element-mobilizing transposase RayT